MRTVLSLFISLSLVLAACGGATEEEATTLQATTTGGDVTTSSTRETPPVSLEGKVNDHGTATVEGGSLELEQDDFYFEPTFIEAEPGTTVEVEVTNEGSTAHTFTVEGQDIDIEVAPGETKTVEVTIPDSGNLPFFCRFHVGRGMQGSFVTSTG